MTTPISTSSRLSESRRQRNASRAKRQLPNSRRERASKLAAIAFGALLLVMWELAARQFSIAEYILPAPSAIADSLAGGFLVDPTSGVSYVPDLITTMKEALFGLAIGSVSGVITGMLTAQSPLAERLIVPYVLAIQSIPKMALAPLFIIWFGYGITSKIWIIITIVFFPLLINSISGLRSVDPELVQMGEASGASRWQLFRHIRLPMALPYIFAGLEMGVTLSLVGAIVGEFVGAQSGLGVVIQQRMAVVDGSGVYSVLIILSAIGLTMSWILRVVRNRVLFWAPAQRAQGHGA